MQTIDTMKHGITASETGVIVVSNPSSQISDPFDFREQLETYLFENLPTKVGRVFNQSTPLVVEVDSTDSIPIVVEVDSTDSISITEWHEDFNLGLWYFKPYLNSTVLDNNSTLLREMLSEIDSLLMNEYDWDEIDYRKPTSEDINCAKDTLIKFVKVIGYGRYSLTKPYISNSEDGGAKIEWHSDKRSLYLRINCQESVATEIQDEQDGTTTIDRKPLIEQNYLSLWKWIING